MAAFVQHANSCPSCDPITEDDLRNIRWQTDRDRVILDAYHPDDSNQIGRHISLEIHSGATAVCRNCGEIIGSFSGNTVLIDITFKASNHCCYSTNPGALVALAIEREWCVACLFGRTHTQALRRQQLCSGCRSMSDHDKDSLARRMGCCPSCYLEGKVVLADACTHLAQQLPEGESA